MQHYTSSAQTDKNSEQSPSTAPTQTVAQDWQTIRFLLPFLRKHCVSIVAALVFLVLAKLMIIAIPITLKKIVDSLTLNNVTVDNSATNVDWAITVPVSLLVAYGCLRLFSIIFQELRNAVFARTAQQTTREISLLVFAHLHSLSLRFHLDRKTGGLSRDIERGTRSIQAIYRYILFAIFPTLLEISLVCIYLSYEFGWVFSSITLLTIVLYGWLTYAITTWRIQFRIRMNEADSVANTSAIDSLINYETVKYFTNEQHEQQRFDHHLQNWQKESIKSELSLSLLNTLQGMVVACGATTLLMLAAHNVVSGEFTIGDFVMISAFIMQLFIPLNFLGTIFREIKRALIDMNRIFGLLNESQEVKEPIDAAELNTRKPSIRFKNVEFSYHEQRNILQGVSFTIQGGQKVAVVGASGAGKSTLARLLFRFYDVNSGSIHIGKHNIQNVTLHSLRKTIGIVPQDTVLFNDSLLYNVQYGQPDASMYDVIKAIKMANLEQFVEQLPDGLETQVGERGLKLSGGEKQRVAIARTILKNPDILILDEATSSLDSETERDIQNALNSVTKNRTTLIIAHRLSTIIDADNIIVLDQGQIIETGTHQELLTQNGTYHRLWTIQQDEKETPEPS